MRVVSLLQAGGKGERMGAPKPLVPVAGLCLLERNFLRQLGSGFRDIVVSVPPSPVALRDWVEGRGAELARAVGGTVSALVEEAPLGTIGCARTLCDRADVVVVAFADNLTAVDLQAMLEHHLQSEAAMTLAAYAYPLRNDFGELVLEDRWVRAYREKPVRTVTICSGTYVLGREALDAMPQGRDDAPALVERLLGAGARVAAFHHGGPWIDVNSPRDVARAEALLAQDGAELERWAAAPDDEVVGAVLLGPEGVLLERRPDDARLYPGQWDTPGGKIQEGESSRAALARELAEELGLEVDVPAPVRVFDDIDVASGALVRHHVFALRIRPDEARAREGQVIAWHDLGNLDEVSVVAQRSIHAARRLG